MEILSILDKLRYSWVFITLPTLALDAKELFKWILVDVATKETCYPWYLE